jgi:hypothetical protein
MKPQTVTFRGKRWKVRWKKQKDSFGKCDAPSTPAKAICIDPGLSGQSKLYVCLHEGVHACLFDLDETAVTEMSTDLSNWLWRLGLRFEDERPIDIGPAAEAILNATT